MTEGEIKRVILDYLELAGAMPCVTGQKRKCFRSKYMRPGEPDVRAIWKGRPLFIEVKKPGGVVSDAQRDFITRAIEKGAIAFVAYSLEDVIEHLS
jgi:hypothetical protein